MKLLKVLVKEVKSLRNSQAELKQSWEEKSNMEVQNLAEDNDFGSSPTVDPKIDGRSSLYGELRRMLTSILVDNGTLRNRVN